MDHTILSNTVISSFLEVVLIKAMAQMLSWECYNTQLSSISSWRISPCVSSTDSRCYHFTRKCCPCLEMTHKYKAVIVYLLAKYWLWLPGVRSPGWQNARHKANELEDISIFLAIVRIREFIHEQFWPVKYQKWWISTSFRSYGGSWWPLDRCLPFFDYLHSFYSKGSSFLGIIDEWGRQSHGSTILSGLGYLPFRARYESLCLGIASRSSAVSVTC